MGGINVFCFYCYSFSGTPRNVKNKSDDESQETGENNGKNDKSKLDTESILMNLMKQINFLHETNSKMFRNLQGERRKFHEILL